MTKNEKDIITKNALRKAIYACTYQIKIYEDLMNMHLSDKDRMRFSAKAAALKLERESFMRLQEEMGRD